MLTPFAPAHRGSGFFYGRQGHEGRCNLLPHTHGGHMDDTDPLDTIESILTARSTHHKTGELMPQFILTAWDAHQILDAINETRQRISSLSLSLKRDERG
jgi:hypothetical protein